MTTLVFYRGEDDAPHAMLPVSSNAILARHLWLFFVEHMAPGWRVALLQKGMPALSMATGRKVDMSVYREVMELGFSAD